MDSGVYNHLCRTDTLGWIYVQVSNTRTTPTQWLHSIIFILSYYYQCLCASVSIMIGICVSFSVSYRRQPKNNLQNKKHYRTASRISYGRERQGVPPTYKLQNWFWLKPNLRNRLIRCEVSSTYKLIFKSYSIWNFQHALSRSRYDNWSVAW